MTVSEESSTRRGGKSEPNHASTSPRSAPSPLPSASCDSELAHLCSPPLSLVFLHALSGSARQMPPAVYTAVIDIPSSPEPVRARAGRHKPSSSRPRARGKNVRDYPSPKLSVSKTTSVIDLSGDDDDDDAVPFATAASVHRHLPTADFTFSAESKDIRNPFSEKLPSSPSQAMLNMDLSQDVPAEDPLDRMLASILEILPDVLPAHALMLIRQLSPTYDEGTAHAVVQYLFDHPDYPKVKRQTGKRRREDDDVDGMSDSPSKKSKVDYASTSRSYPQGPSYSILAEEQLFEDFPLVPRP